MRWAGGDGVMPPEQHWLLNSPWHMKRVGAHNAPLRDASVPITALRLGGVILPAPPPDPGRKAWLMCLAVMA